MRAWSTVRAAFVAITMLAAGLFPAGGVRADDPDPTGSLLDPGQLVVTGKPRS